MRRAICFAMVPLLWLSAISVTYAEMPLRNRSIAVMQPGKGIGDIALGDVLETVVRKMGMKPTNGQRVKTGGVDEYWMDYEGLGITFIFDAMLKLDRIAVSNPGIVMQGCSVRVNSRSDSLPGAFGSGIIKVVNDQYEQHIYRGVKFTVNRRTQIIEAIIIERMR